MSSELSGVSGPRKLTSKRRASLETVSEKKKIEPSGLKELEQFKMEMNKIDQGLILAREIQQTLEGFLRDLSSAE